MKVLLTSEGKNTLWFEYVDANWNNCKQRWSSVYSGNVPHMGNNTNNRLESSWQKRKSLVDRSTALDECVVSSLFWQTVNERAWARTINRVGVYVNVEYDDELNTLSNLVSRHAVELAKQQKATNCARVLDESVLYPRWLLKIYRHLKNTTSSDNVEDPFEIRGIHPPDVTRIKAQTEKFKELQAVGKPIAEIGCQWGTKAHAALTSTLVEFVRVVKTGSCPVVRQPDGGADESINTPHKSDTNSNHRNESQDETGAHSETETGIFSDIGSEVKATIADYADSGEGRSLLSVTGCAVMSFIDELDEGLPSSQLSEASTRDNPETEPRNDTVSPPQTVCETPAVPDTIADTEENNEEVRSDDNVETTLEAAPDDDGEKEASVGGCGDEVTTRGANKETTSLTKPQWKISTSVKKSGQPNITQAARKKVDCEAMREMYAVGLRAVSVLRTKRPKITMCEKTSKKPTALDKGMTVLPTRTLDAVATQIAIYRNRCSDTSSYAEVDTTLDLFSEVETALAWVGKYDVGGWEPREACWTEDLLNREAVTTRLKDVNVLSDDVWITSLCGRKWLEGACLDRTVKTIIELSQDTLQDTATLFTMPSNIMRFPVTDPVWLQKQTVWEEMRVAYQTTDLESKCHLYFAIVCFELDHWCAVVINLGTGDGKIYDPQETSDRYAKLQTYLKAELVPLLPPLPSPKSYRFQQHTWMRQQDNCNYGLFILLFLEACLTRSIR
ncbi:hypothetical protein PI125_g16502 [Phytophthora idaei]|nr:hypothetical protein PI125_g16502 [Phytophthora idaei]